MRAISYTLPDETTGSPFSIKFNACTRTPASWKEEIFAAARDVANEAGSKKIWVCMSGGIDSEIVAHAFHEQGINFAALSIRHTAGTNEHDVRHAVKWCRTHGVPHHVVDLDMKLFLSDGIRPYRDAGYVTGNVFRYLQIRLLELVEEMGGYAVLGSGEQLYTVKADPKSGDVSDPFLKFEIGYAIPLEWIKRNNTIHEPYFFFRSPEVCRAYLNIPIVNFAIGNSGLFVADINKYIFKRLVSHGEFPSIDPRVKFNGFERVKRERRTAQSDLQKYFGARIRSVVLPVNTLKDQLDGTA